MRFLIRRIGFYVIALWAALTLNFFMPRLMPGNPVQIMLAKFKGRIGPDAINAFAATFGLNHQGNLLTQYLNYLVALLHGHLGISISMYPTSVSAALFQALPWTLFLMGTATIISFVLGTVLGIYSAWYRGSLFDTIVPTFFNVTSALPYFWFALIVLYYLALQFQLFPVSGGQSTSSTGFSLQNMPDILYHAILPAFTIIITSVGGWLLSMRNNMLSTLSEDFMLVARAKGLSSRRLKFKYAARNAILPNMTGFAMSLGFILGGTLLTEVVFSYPGLGSLMFQAVQAEDYPLLQGALLLIAVTVLLANLVVDLLMIKLDPRVRQG